MTEVSIGVAVAAGLLSFISPCVLALLPVYLAFLGNAAVADDSGTVAATRAAVLPQALRHVAAHPAETNHSELHQLSSDPRFSNRMRATRRPRSSSAA